MYFSVEFIFMKNYTVRLYQKTDYSIWNSFVETAKNATFLFHRDFMEYHADRFNDYSLLVFENKKLVAIVPANRVGETVYSHQGLSYGGLIYGENIKTEVVVLILKTILKFLNEHKIDKLYFKIIPSIYNKKPAEEINYALFLANSKLVRCDSLSVIDLNTRFEFSKLRKRNIKKIKDQNKLLIVWEKTFKPFWETILIPNLEKKFNVKPVHTLIEIENLRQKFRHNIHQFDLYKNDKLICGTTIFETDNVAHAQYISGNEGLDYLFNHLITNHFKEKNFFDFGTSNELNGTKLNAGLSNFKESFGASTIVQNFYEIDTKSYNLLDNFLI